MTPRERDEFRRIGLAADMERARGLILEYEEHQAHFRDRVEQARYEMGKLDERLGA